MQDNHPSLQLNSSEGSMNRRQIETDAGSKCCPQWVPSSRPRIGLIEALLSLYTPSTSRREYLESVVELISEWSGCQGVGIRVLDKEENIPYEAYKGFSREFWDQENFLSLKRDQCVCTRVVAGTLREQDRSCVTTAGSFLCNDTVRFVGELSEEARLRFRGVCVRWGYLSVAVVPFRWQDRILGAIHLADERAGMVHPEMVEHLEQVAPILGEAVHRFELEEEQQRNYDAQALLNSLLHLSLQELSLSDLLQRILDLVVSAWQFQFKSAAIFITERNKSTLALKAWSSSAEPTSACCESVAFGECHCGRAALTKRIQYIAQSAQADEKTHQSWVPHGHYCVPIIGGESVLGVLNIQLRAGFEYYRHRAHLDNHLSAVANVIAGLLLRKQAEEELRSTLKRQELILSSIPVVLYSAKPGGDFDTLWVSGNSEAVIGVPAERFMQEPGFWASMIHPEDRQRVLEEFLSIFLTGKVDSEYRWRCGDGSYRWILDHAALRHDKRGQAKLIVGTWLDITERKQVENALKESESRFREIFYRAAIGIVLVDIEGQITDANPAFLSMIGCSIQEITGKRVIELIHPDDVSVTVELFHKLLAGDLDQYRIERRHVRKTGEIVWVNITASLIRDPKGSPLHVISLVEDITSRKELEMRLVRAQKLETAGRIAGQVAHDFNNLLGPIVAYPDLIKRHLQPGHPAYALCNMIEEAAEKMAVINEDMMALARRGQFDSQPVDLNELIRQVVVQQVDDNDTLQVDLKLADTIPPVSGSPAQLSRVISNLISNALEAMQDEGVLSIRTECVKKDQLPECADHPTSDEYIRMDVGDNGPGIPLEIRDRIFDAFFSTKTGRSKRGAGLGLSIVHAIVQDHHGYVDLQSELGRGTTFSVYLPVCRDDDTEEKPSDELPRGTERILVVDDDPIQLKVVKTLLETLGYQVDTASSGEEALALLRERQQDLLILDMVMPGGIDGAETYRRALEMYPEQKVMILSGFARPEQMQDALSNGVNIYLSKPITLEKLSRAVRSVLDRQS